MPRGSEAYMQYRCARAYPASRTTIAAKKDRYDHALPLPFPHGIPGQDCTNRAQNATHKSTGFFRHSFPPSRSRRSRLHCTQLYFPFRLLFGNGGHGDLHVIAIRKDLRHDLHDFMDIKHCVPPLRVPGPRQRPGQWQSAAATAEKPTSYAAGISRISRIDWICLRFLTVALFNQII